MKITKYPDSTSYINLEEEDQRKEFTFKVNNYEDLWHLNQFVDAYNNYLKTPPIIVIPNLIDAQADKRFNLNESSGLKLVCKFLNRMHASFKIFHPHNPEVVEALMDNVKIIDNTIFIDRVMQHVSILKTNLVLMSSDAGGFKPLMKLCNKINWQGETYSASKSRSVATVNGKITSKLQQFVDKQDFEGKDILIIDDISVYGGTFKGLSTLLRQRNCGKLYLAVSHITIQNLKGEDPITNYFDRIFTTNSKFDNYYIEDKFGETKAPNNLEVIKIF